MVVFTLLCRMTFLSSSVTRSARATFSQGEGKDRGTTQGEGEEKRDVEAPSPTKGRQNGENVTYEEK